MSKTRLRKNYTTHIYYTWALYFSLFPIILTLSPFNFGLDKIGDFSWSIGSLDIVENLVLFFPIGLFLVLSKEHVKIIQLSKYVLFGFMLSTSIETAQLFLESRSSQYWDIIANTISMILGVFFAMLTKPIFKKFSVASSEVARLISAIMCTGILLLVRQMMHQQNIGIFELYLLFSSSILLAIILAHYDKKNSNSLFYNNLSIVFLFSTLSLFPLFISTPILFFKLSLMHMVLTTVIFFILVRGNIDSYKRRKKVTLFISTLLSIVILIVSIYSSLNQNNGMLMFFSDKVQLASEGRKYGGVIVGILLLGMFSANLINLLLQNFKLKPFIKIDVI